MRAATKEYKGVTRCKLSTRWERRQSNWAPVPVAVYGFIESFPEREKYGLAHQMRRAAVSILANMAEGIGKRNHAEKAPDS